MKKIYLLLVALVAAMSVNAAVDKLYLIGELAGGWAANKGTEMTKVADGVFTLDIEVGEIKNTHFGFASQLAQSEDDWDTLKSNRYGSSSNNIAANIGDNTMQKGDNTWTITPGHYTFTVNTNTMIFTVKEYGSQPVQPEYRFRMWGNIFSTSAASWVAGDLDYVDGKWTAELEVKLASGEFGIQKIKGDSQEWYAAQAGSQAVVLDTPMGFTNSNCQNFIFTVSETGVYSFTIDEVSSTLTISKVAGAVIAAPDMYMLGTVDQDTWNVANRKHKMTNVPGTKRYYSDFVEFKGNPNGDGYSYFLFTSTPGSSEGDWDTANKGRYSPGVDDIPIHENGYAYQIKLDANNKSFYVPTGTVMRTVIDLDTRYNEFYLAEHLVPETLYLHGDLWKHRFDWSGLHGAVRKDNGDETSTYTFEGMLIEDHGNGRGYFTLSNWCKNGEAEAMMLAESADGTPDVSELAANGHAYTNASTVLLKNTYTTPEEALIEVEPNRYYNITVRLNNNGTVNSIEHKDVTDTVTTGVEGVEAEDADAAVEYYNMQGMRVAQPKSGIYIRRQGNTVSKVIFGGK